MIKNTAGVYVRRYVLSVNTKMYELNDLGYNINGDCRIDKTVKIYKDIRNAVNNN